MSRYLELSKTGIRFLETTGLPVEEFDKYLPQFTLSYRELNPLEERMDGLGQIEDKLLLIWLYQAQHMPLPELAAQFHLTQIQVAGWIEHLLPVLQLAQANLSQLKLQPNCAHFLNLLNEHNVAYLVVGGYAVAYYGYQRPILDLDVFIATERKNAEKFGQVLQAIGSGVTMQVVELFQLPERVIRIGQPPFTVERFASDDRFVELGRHPLMVEVMTSISAVTFETCYPARVLGVIDQVAVPIIALSHLKINKAASIRPKDADDWAHLS